MIRIWFHWLFAIRNTSIDVFHNSSNTKKYGTQTKEKVNCLKNSRFNFILFSFCFSKIFGLTLIIQNSFKSKIIIVNNKNTEKAYVIYVFPSYFCRWRFQWTHRSCSFIRSGSMSFVLFAQRFLRFGFRFHWWSLFTVSPFSLIRFCTIACVAIAYSCFALSFLIAGK